MSDWVVCRSEQLPANPVDYLRAAGIGPRWLEYVYSFDHRVQRFEYRAIAPFGLVDARAFEYLRANGWLVTFYSDPTAGRLILVEPMLRIDPAVARSKAS